MEKLIELINEHQKEIHPDGIYLPIVAYRHGLFYSDSDCLSWVIDEIHLISKPYGFIKWLVENDKIDKKKIRSPIMHYKVEETRDGGINYYDLDFADKINSLLMILSISSSPIDDLISYLK